MKFPVNALAGIALTILFCSLLVSGIVCETQGAEQVPVVYSGIITRSAINPYSQSIGTPSVYTFQAEVSYDRYRITLVAVHDLSCFEQVAGSDGLDCYFQQKMWKSWVDNGSSDFQESADVTPGPFPALADQPIQLVWMLFASHKSMTNGQSIALTPIHYAPYDKLKAKIEYSESFDWPQKVEMYSPGTELIQGKEYPIPHPYEDGYKLWDLNVVATGETNGMTFPQDAVFSQYTVFMSNSNTPALGKIHEMEIVVTNVSEGSLSQSDYLPVLSHTNLIAADYRFSPHLPRVNQGPVDMIQDRLVNGKWLDRSDSNVKQSGMWLKGGPRRTINKRSHVQRTIEFGLLALITIILFGFLLKRKLG